NGAIGAHQVLGLDTPARDMTIVERRDLRMRPRAGMNAVRDRVDGVAWKELAGRLRVPLRDAVHEIGRASCRDRGAIAVVPAASIRDFHVTGVQTCALPIWNGAIGAHQVLGLDTPARDMTIVERRDLRMRPRAGMNAVRDRVDGVAWKELAGRLRVPLRDAVH